MRFALSGDNSKDLQLGIVIEGPVALRKRKRLSQRKVRDPILELIIECGHYHDLHGDPVVGT